MNVPKAVIFDLGKVLLDFDYGITARALAPKCKYGADRLCQIFALSPFLLRYETSAISTGEFYRAVKSMAGYTGGFEEFSRSFADIFRPIDPMIRVQRELRRRGVKTFLFSNTNELAVEHIRRQFAFFSEFDGYILSYDRRAMKPEPEIYEAVERQTGWSGADLLYIDDRPENIETGIKRGWQTILHRSAAETIAVLEQVGLIRDGGGAKGAISENMREVWRTQLG